VIRVMLVDDHPVVLEGLRSYLALDPDLRVVGVAATAGEALSRLSLPAERPDVVLLDMHLPDMDGPSAVRAIRDKAPQAAVVALSSFAEDGLIVAAVRSGAAGYLLKAVPPETLRDAIKTAATGVRVLHPDVERILLRYAEQHGHPDPLSPRELQVLALMGRGFSNKEIGADLGITEKTVKTHVSHILAKMGVQDRTQAVLAAIRDRYIDAPGTRMRP
jgi:DNA-binding NarL/FixJ family response regulator